ncbi:MAG: hypothetical protein IKG25_11440, partial [Mogibacterium sp.]|nr:hypothetical protein [Mogibacterium sp.]
LEKCVLFNRKLEARLPSAPIFFLKSLNEYTLQGFQCQAVSCAFSKNNPDRSINFCPAPFLVIISPRIIRWRHENGSIDLRQKALSTTVRPDPFQTLQPDPFPGAFVKKAALNLVSQVFFHVFCQGKIPQKPDNHAISAI